MSRRPTLLGWALLVISGAVAAADAMALTWVQGLGQTGLELLLWAVLLAALACMLLAALAAAALQPVRPLARPAHRVPVLVPDPAPAPARAYVVRDALPGAIELPPGAIR